MVHQISLDSSHLYRFCRALFITFQAFGAGLRAKRPGLPALVWVDHPFLRRPFPGELAKHLPIVDQLVLEDEMALRFSINLPEIQMF